MAGEGLGEVNGKDRWCGIQVRRPERVIFSAATRPAPPRGGGGGEGGRRHAEAEGEDRGKVGGGRRWEAAACRQRALPALPLAETRR